MLRSYTPRYTTPHALLPPIVIQTRSILAQKHKPLILKEILKVKKVGTAPAIGLVRKQQKQVRSRCPQHPKQEEQRKIKRRMKRTCGGFSYDQEAS
ncbi:MAG TPA: hypothetical protein VF050_00050 [Moraxellaceae bacterium]